MNFKIFYFQNIFVVRRLEGISLKDITSLISNENLNNCETYNKETVKFMPNEWMHSTTSQLLCSYSFSFKILREALFLLHLIKSKLFDNSFVVR